MTTGQSGGLVRPRLLVIDDDELAGRILTEVLEAGGFRVTRLTTPIGATRLLMRESFAAVVVDLLMPAMRGDRLAALFRGNARLRALPVVIVSGQADEELRLVAGSVEDLYVLHKSDVQTRLVPLLKSLLERSEGSAEPGSA